MADQNLILPANAEPKRDSYGFAVRPQHLQRYREYGSIYNEEEEERSEKWRKFLEQCSESVRPCTRSQEHLQTSKAEATTRNTEAVPENPREGDDSGSGKSTPGSSREGRADKQVSVVKETKRHKIQTWAPIRSSLAPIEKIMSVRVRKKVYMENDYVPSVQKHLPPIDEETSTKRNSEQLPNTEVPSEAIDVETKSLDDSPECKFSLNASRETREFSNVPDQEAELTANSCDNGATLSSSSQDEAMIADENDRKEQSDSDDFFPWKQELESLIHGGIPKSLRGEVWQAFVGVRARRVERYYQELLSLGVDSDGCQNLLGAVENVSTACTPEKWRKQIEKDLPRTFPGHPALDEEGRNSLRRILTAYARHNPSVGYCQAMNFFAGLLLLLMPEENAFWTLVGIIDDYFDGYFTDKMIESQVDQLVFEDVMHERFPKLVNHLDYLGVEVTWISGPWFLSIFVNMLPWESVLRVWDVLLFEGNRVMLFRTALALMELYGPALVTTKDAGDAVTLLQSLTGSTFDSSQLVFTACMGFLAVTEARLEELRSKHRPSVLGIIDERTKGTEVSKDSKSLATKLYSFKHHPPSLIKEPDPNEGLGGKLNDPARSKAHSSLNNFDEFMCGLSIDSEINSLPDLQDQVIWLKVELCRLMDEKRLATLRAEELETAFLEIVKQDNRRQLSARVEQLEQEVALLQQALSDKQEQERAMLQVLMRVEQEQKVTEDARIAAEQDVAAQKYAVYVLQEKYEKAMASLAEMGKRAVMAESMLEATLQYESGQSKSLSSPRSTRSDSPRTGRRTSLLSFGLGWRDRNKGRSANDEDLGENRSLGKSNREDKVLSNVDETSDAKPTNDVIRKSSQQNETNGHQKL